MAIAPSFGAQLNQFEVNLDAMSMFRALLRFAVVLSLGGGVFVGAFSGPVAAPGSWLGFATADAQGLTCDYPPEAAGTVGASACNPGFAGHVVLAKNLGGPGPDCPACDFPGGINAAIGSYFLAETDYPGAGPDPIVFRRYYNSRDSGTHAFGANWYGSYGRALTINSATSITVRRDDGRQFAFTYANGAWGSDGDVVGTLATVTSGGSTTGYTFTNAADETETYNTGGQLQSVRTRAGLVQTMGYNGGGQLTSITDAPGRQVTLTWNGNGQISQVKGPDGLYWTYSYDSSNRLISATNPASATRQYLYENTSFPTALTGLTDEDGNRWLTVAYNSSGWATSAQHAGGADLTAIDYTYYAGYGVVSVTNPLGAQIWHLFQAVDGSARDAQTAIVCWSCYFPWGTAANVYDANGNLTSAQDYDSETTTRSFDTTRNLETQRVTADGQTITTAWSPSFRLPTQISDPAHVYTFGYDGSGDLLTLSVAAAGGGSASQWSWTYNAGGLPATATDPDGDTTTFYYDPSGNMDGVRNALGQTTQITSHDVNGRPTAILDPNGVTTQLTWNFRGQLTGRTVGSQATTFSYDAAGNLVRRTNPDGSYLIYGYDQAHRLGSITDATGGAIQLNRDAMGNVTARTVVNAAGTTVWSHSWSYDGLGRLSYDTGANYDTSSYFSDLMGNLLFSFDPNWNQTNYTYDAGYRMTSATNGNIANAFNYDAVGRLTSVRDGRSLLTTFSYNALDERTATVSPDSGSSSISYTAAGDPLTVLDGNHHGMTYSYDALHRPTAALTNSGSRTTWSYDQAPGAIGYLTAMSDPGGTTQWTWDGYGHIASKTQTSANTTITTRWNWSAATGQLTGMTYPSGNVLSYGFDANGRISAITQTPAAGGSATTVIGNVTWIPFGPATSWTVTNAQAATVGVSAVTVSRTIDGDGRIRQVFAPYWVNTSSGWTQPALTLGYDPNGNINWLAQSFIVGQSLYYDAHNRLYQVNAGNTYQTFAYDKAGNRTAQTSFDGTNTTSLSYTYDSISNHLKSIGGARSETFTWDAAGNMLTHVFLNGSLSYLYNARNHMNSVVTSGSATLGLTMTYQFNGLGYRAIKNVPGSPPVVFDYDPWGHLIGRYNANIGAEETVYLGDTEVALMMPGAVYSAWPDQLGVPLALADTRGNIVWSWSHDVFGNGTASGSLTTYKQRLPGQYVDPETGIFYNYARDYDPVVGRYIEADPIGTAGGPNAYAYVGNNPATYSDPRGMQVQFAPPPGVDLGATCVEADRADPFGGVGVADPVPGRDALPFGQGAPLDVRLYGLNEAWVWAHQAALRSPAPQPLLCAPAVAGGAVARAPAVVPVLRFMPEAYAAQVRAGGTPGLHD